MDVEEDEGVMDVEESEETSEEESGDEEQSYSKSSKSVVYLPGKPLEKGEELVCDDSAYVMLHQAFTGSPCLSFDVIRDELGNDRESFPLTAYVVAGTQSDRAQTNSIFVMKMSNLRKTHKQKENNSDDDDSESSSDEEDNSTNKPKLECARIKHKGCVNRIRSTHHSGSVLAATWSELGRVEIWNLTRQLQALDDPRAFANYKQTNAEDTTTPVFSFSGHQMEGFGLDWCPTELGVLASGDCQRNIHIWLPNGTSSWVVNQRPLSGHTDSVEDLQWSPNEKNVLASCSVDKTIRIWDVRVGAKKANMLTVEEAHTSDVNVISWNKNEPFICSGGDDGFLHVWDLRQLKEAVVTFKHHTGPVTSVEWHPSEATVVASAGSDDQIALWDLSLERDDEAIDEDLKDLPPQLLFIHQGQTDLKELHWHPQLPGVLISTALSGFNIFRTISL